MYPKRIVLFLFILVSSVSQAQDLYDINSFREITIKFYDANYHQTLIDSFNAGSSFRLPASLEMDGLVLDSVGVRYKGNISFLIAEWSGLPKFPLNIDINEYVDDQTLMGYKKMKLGNLFTDPTGVREAVAYEFYRTYSVAPKSNMVKVNIGVVGQDASYYGVYSNSESINKDFLKDHYGWKKGALVKCDPNPQDADIACDNSGLGNGVGGEQVTAFPDLVWYGPDSCQYYANYEMKSDHGWGELVDFIGVLNNEDSLLYDNLNIDGVLWYMAVSMVLPNIDTYFGKNIKNYYMYRHRDELWHLIPWDVNETFGGVMGNAHAEYDVLRWFDPNEPNRPLIWQILKHDRYYKQYFAHLRTVVEENYNEEFIRARVDSIQELIEQAVIDGPYKRFPDTAFTENVDNDVFFQEFGPLGFYKAFIPTVNQRLEYLNNHPELMKIPPTLINTSRNIEVPEEGQNVWITAEVSNASQVDLMVTKNENYASFFEPIEMKDDGQSNDGVAGDGIYGAMIPYQALDDEVKYYVRAQNDEAMILEPRRAEYEFFEYKIEAFSNTTITDPDINTWYSIYPNPAKGLVNIVGDLDKVNSINIHDLSGRLVFQSIRPSSNSISVADFSSGLYAISFLTANGLVTKKLIVE